MLNLLQRTIIEGRLSCYVKKTKDFNPYEKSDVYDWEFKKEINRYIFKDSYRGFNPYAGVEVIIEKDSNKVVWICDYVGYVLDKCPIGANQVYDFLKEARAKHLVECNDDLFKDFTYEKELLKYKSIFELKATGVLEKTDIYYDKELIAQHIASWNCENMKMECYKI
ncbi:DUF5680 domain-containing protein [Caldicellulosiruptor acetigenus]|uniref:DUF5680 domain-containing protein n=1 Tax=Caldicellulosiruptor acetigenus TaxID=301953 RepID=UPI0003FF73E0|nr:DUF5680 domain-containing protein [Caldicellulosiruptor acetigenus]WAM35609.1 DUF5680 domain-containing protein [Caldicellulosiruptor acetigenus]